MIVLPQVVQLEMIQSFGYQLHMGGNFQVALQASRYYCSNDKKRKFCFDERLENNNNTRHWRKLAQEK